MTRTEKLLTIIAWQLSASKTRICPSCGHIGNHNNDCELYKMEEWAKVELIGLWKETIND